MECLGAKVRLDPINLGARNGDPLYLQVERRIENLLLSGPYRTGERIPPETNLATFAYRPILVTRPQEWVP